MVYLHIPQFEKEDYRLFENALIAQCGGQFDDHLTRLLPEEQQRLYYMYSYLIKHILTYFASGV